MTIKNIASSSSGNCTIIEAENTIIMIDAGISLKTILEKYGKSKDEFSIDAILITHEHSDHVKGAGVVGRHTKAPIYIPEPSYEKRTELFKDCLINYIAGGDTFTINDELEISVFNTKHDSEACVGFKIREIKTNKCFGLLTDTGVITKLIKKSLEGCNALFIESDYDEESLVKYAEYDDNLKERIRSPLGHLSNTQAIEYMKELDLENIEWIILGHLSHNTNSPELLLSYLEQEFEESINQKLHIAKNELLELTI